MSPRNVSMDERSSFRVVRSRDSRVTALIPVIRGMISIARMKSPAGWREPGQRPEFREITVVLEGALHVAHEDGDTRVGAGQAIVAEPGEWVRYSSPEPDGAAYVSICVPAFSPGTVNRDDED